MFFTNLTNYTDIYPDYFAQPEKVVKIPAGAAHNGIYSIHVKLVWVCPKCGGPRGELSTGLSYDGSRRLGVNTWSNPCGHIDKYFNVRTEAICNGLN